MAYYCRKCRRWHSGGAIARSHKMFAKKVARKPIARPKAKPKVSYRPKPVSKPTAPIKKKILAPIVKKQLERPIRRAVPRKPAVAPAKTVPSINGKRVKAELASLQKLQALKQKMLLYEGYVQKLKWQKQDDVERILIQRRKKKALESLQKYWKFLKSDPAFKVTYTKKIVKE